MRRTLLGCWQTLAGVATFALLSCGGKAVTDGEQPGPAERTGSSSTGASEDAGQSERGNSASGSDLDTTLELGDCEKGWAPGDAPCPWLASDGLCYAAKADACACICPAQGMTVCTSGLPGDEDSRVPVTCL